MSYANVLRGGSPVAPNAEQDLESASPSGQDKVAVVDANAIINGIRVDSLAARLVTVPEVLDEIRDKQSRQFLATLPFGVETKEPSEESIKAGA
jgi:RNA-binding protein NOB1